MIHETFIVENLKCSGCAKTITNSLTSIKGVNKVEVFIDNAQVEVDFDEAQCKRQNIAEKLKKLGYPENGEGNFVDKMKSYVSCAVGKFS
jgi:copper chaperone CopZ